MDLDLARHFDISPNYLGLLSLSAAIPPMLGEMEFHVTKNVKLKSRGDSPRQSKKATIVAMLERKNGATIDELVAATGWLGDSVRGQMSLLGSREGLKILSAKTDDARRYFIRTSKASKK